MARKKSKLLFRLLFLLITLVLLAYLFFNENGIVKYIELKSQLKNLDHEIKNSEEQLNALRAEIDSLKNSKVKIEKVARERYHMMLPDERVLRIKEN